MKGKYKAMMNQMKFPTRRGFCLTWLVVAFVSIALDADPLSAQGSNKEEDPRLKARPITLQTKDGMELQAYYFPSDQKKAATTVLLVRATGRFFERNRCIGVEYTRGLLPRSDEKTSRKTL